MLVLSFSRIFFAFKRGIICPKHAHLILYTKVRRAATIQHISVNPTVYNCYLSLFRTNTQAFASYQQKDGKDAKFTIKAVDLEQSAIAGKSRPSTQTSSSAKPVLHAARSRPVLFLQSPGWKPSRVHLTVCTVDFIVFTVAVTVFLTFVFLNFESENTGCRYR